VTASEPTTPEDWQKVVNIMSACLMIQDAINYGVIVVKPEAPMIDVDRCKSLIERGQSLGFLPDQDAVQRMAVELLKQFS
jgi:hypothetical protein